MGYKILLADDSVTVQKIITLTFSDEGVDVITFNSGDEAISSLQYLRPALVMADVSIPGKNGYDICEFVKKHPDLKRTPVVLLVPAFEPIDEKRARSAGADHYLTKPFQSIRTLISTVKSLIEHAGNISVTMPMKDTQSSQPEIAVTQEVLDLNGNLVKVQSNPAEAVNYSSGAINVFEEQEPFATSASNQSNAGEDADHILDLDDVLLEVRPAQMTRYPAAGDELFDGGRQSSFTLPQSVIDEIADRVVAKITEKLPGILRSELAGRLAPEIIEIVKRKPDTEGKSHYEADSLLELDEV